MLTLKKLIVGSVVVGIFCLYSLGIRHETSKSATGETVAVSKPAQQSSSAPTTANTSSSSASQSSTSSNGAGTATQSSGKYKDGTYTGSVADAYYGNVQVSASVSGGVITNVSFLQYPNSHDTSVMINQQAMPYLKQEAIQAQSANVQIITGATFTSQAFIQSLGAALSHA